MLHISLDFYFLHFILSFQSSITSLFCPISLLSLSSTVSPLSFLFFALSDMSQDSSDEDSGEEEDFAQVQFGSRYTTARCVLMRVRTLASGMILLHVPVGPSGLQLTAV